MLKLYAAGLRVKGPAPRPHSVTFFNGSRKKMGREKKWSPFALGADQSQALLSPDFDNKSAVVFYEGFMIYLVLDDP